MCTFDDDAWRPAREASQLQNKSGESVGSAARQRGRWLNGFHGLGRGNRCILRVILWDFFAMSIMHKSKKKGREWPHGTGERARPLGKPI